jgi:hypothetical protein
LNKDDVSGRSVIDEGGLRVAMEPGQRPGYELRPIKLRKGRDCTSALTLKQREGGSIALENERETTLASDLL